MYALLLYDHLILSEQEGGQTYVQILFGNINRAGITPHRAASVRRAF